MNYVVLAVFVGSISYVAFNYHQMMADGASPFYVGIVVLWCMCLAYFFGFFGISFLDQDTLGRSPSSLGLSDVDVNKKQDTKKSAPAAPVAKAKVPGPAAAKKSAPMHDAPICAEKGVVAAQAPADGPEPNYADLTDEEVLGHVLNGSLKDHMLEKKLGNMERAVVVRRKLYEHTLDKKLDLIPYAHYDYDKVFGANCEIVVGYIPIPVGIVGPLVINGEPVYVPMATTEGCLVASTNRGCKAISSSGGCNALLLKDAITRAPCLRFPSALRAAALKSWVEEPANYRLVEAAFNSTTNYGLLESLTATVAGRNVYLRFACMSGDAMGMNMVSKGCLKAIELLEEEFPDLVLVAISGNYCTDKKPSAVNWILGRGKSIVVEAVIPEKIVKSVLKTTCHDIIESNKQKNHIGSAMAGSIGGFNAHAANIVTAVFLATGQDPAQNVESSNCLTIMEYAEDGTSLHVSVTMPSIEVGTVGGGTHLPAQAGCLDICGVRGASRVAAGDNARQLAKIVGASVLAGELSLMAALAANHLVRSHMQHNRKPQTTEPPAPSADTMRRTASMTDVGK
jgi:hydroxymethylglutaryl-CoA reductase (NADPH)